MAKIGNKIAVSLRSLLSASDRADGLFRTYLLSFVIIILICFTIIISNFHTQSIYRKKQQAEKRLKSVEATYARSKAEFRNATLNSSIIQYVDERKLGIKKSATPTIEIE